MRIDIYAAILVMAAVTYLIRVLPMTLIRREFKSPFLRSFLYYTPYVTLAVMAFPAILSSTASPWSALAAFAVTLVLSWRGCNLMIVAGSACLVVFLTELLPL